MNTFLSFKLWLIFIQRLINVLYPANIIFLIFLYPVRKKIRMKNIILFVLIFISVDMLVRIVSFFAGVPFSHRYFYLFMILVTIFAGFGMSGFTAFIKKYTEKKYPGLTETVISASILLIVCCAYSGKALHVSGDKKWIKEIASVIKDHTSNREDDAVILSNYDESRFAYYAGCRETLLFDPDNDFQIRHYVLDRTDGRWKELSKGKDAFNNYIAH